jgi:hypothetical protein
VIPPGVACPEVENAVVGVAVSEVAEPLVDIAAVLAVEPDVVFVAVVSTADVAEPQASGGTRVVFDIAIPVFLYLVVELDSRGLPRFFALPSVDHYARSSSSVEVVDRESVHSPIDVRANHGLYNILSNLGLRQNKKAEHCHNNSTLGYNNVTDTSALPMDATTNRPRKRCLRQCQV